VAASDHLSGAQFYHFKRGKAPGYNAVVAADNSGHVMGHMSWGPNDTRVQQLWVQPEQRHQGIATALWQHSQAVEPGLQHHTDRTDAGEGWARSAGGDVPARTDNTSEDVERRGAWAAGQHEERLQRGMFRRL
jgi:GNAT superfamily N-acetyltransferase